jgi:uncharacterized protein YciI
MATFVVELAFDRDETKRLRVRPKHRDYLQELQTQGKLLMAGPWENQTGALLILEAADEREMREILARDPYAYDGAETASIVAVRQWVPVFAHGKRLDRST